MRRWPRRPAERTGSEPCSTRSTIWSSASPRTSRWSERPGGFADEARSGAPRAVHALEALEREHTLIVGEIATARHSVVWLAADGDVDTATRAVAEVLTSIDAHLAASNRLAMEIANRELGGD